MTNLTFIAKSALRNRRRSLSSVASLIVFFTALTVLWAVWFSFYSADGSGPEGQRVITRNRVSLFFPVLTYYRDQIRKIPGVVNIAQLNFFGGIYKDGSPKMSFAQYGTDANEIFQVYTEWKAPIDQIEAFKNDPAGAAVPEVLAKRYNWKIGDRVLLKGTITPVNLELTIRTIFETPTAWDALLFHWQPVAESMPYLKGLEGFYVTRLDSATSVNRVSQQIDQMFRNAPQPTKTQTESAFGLESLARIGNLKVFLLAVASAVAFALLLITANTISLNMRERVREVAVMRVLGFTKTSLFAMLVGEAVAICIAGCILGASAGKLVIYYAGQAPAGQILSSVHIGVVGGITLLMTAMLIGLISACIPAYHASHSDIVKSIRFLG